MINRLDSNIIICTRVNSPRKWGITKVKKENVKEKKFYWVKLKEKLNGCPWSGAKGWQLIPRAAMGHGQSRPAQERNWGNKCPVGNRQFPTAA